MNRIHFLRAYWSDIILVESKGEYALIDTGYERDYERILAYLEEVGACRLSFILITHFHKDHYGSLPKLLKTFPVDKVYLKCFSGLNVTDGSGKGASEEYNRQEMERCEAMCRLAQEVSSLVRIDESLKEVEVGDFTFRLFGTSQALRELYESPDSPYRGQIRFGENTNSIALYTELFGRRIYLGADCGNEELAFPKYSRVNEQYAREIGKKLDIYKVPHHGCGEIFSPELLSIFEPRYSIVTNFWATAERRYRANAEMLRAGSPNGQILYTDCCGYVFEIGEDGSLSCEAITPVPEIHLEEISEAETPAFFDQQIRYLVDDEIIDEEDIEYFSGEEYRGAVKRQMSHPSDPMHLVYFVRNHERIGAAIYSVDEGGKGFIYDFWVFPPYRGMGTGHYCYYALEKAMIAQGAVRFEMNIQKPRPYLFWRAFGYQESGRDEWGDPLYAMELKDL